MKKLLRGLGAAFTTPDAIKKEKSFAAFAVARVVIGLGGSAAFADIIVRLAGA